MEIHGDKLKWKRGENDFFIVLRAKSTLNPKSQRIYLKVKVVKGVKKGQMCSVHLINNYEDHPILLEATTSLSKSR